jgi:hypothetical protein
MLVNTLDKHKNLSGYDETHLAIILEIMDNKLLSSDSELYARYLSRYITEKEILESIRNFAASLLRIKVIKDGKRRWVEKTPTNFLYWKLWKKIFPYSKFINIVRDGRDVVSSGIFFNYYDSQKGAASWVNGILMSRKNSEEFKKDYLEIKYEDLVLNTEVTMRKILGFIDEEWDSSMVNLEKSTKFVRQWKNKNKSTPISRWKTDKDFNKSEFKKVAGEMLIELGYQKDNKW